MKRVLIISYYWPPTGGSGVQRWVKFAKYLPAEGWQPVIYTPENPEQLAIDEYHMIKEGSAQKKYITLSEGDSIVLEADEETSGAGFTGGMLSAVTAVFDDLLDYIK